MHNTLLFKLDDQPFDVAVIRHIFQTQRGFRDVRFNLPSGRVIEADYVEADDSTVVGLNGDRETISLRGTSDAALHAALTLQRNLDTPLRIIDTDNSFDLILRDYPNVEELRTAIANAQAG
ncbi:MAG TPA: hypothetical protein VHY91_15105 [Pirellulales bacterium]|jgi:hypothetical protein|nr:hypothetical protein [Pirellulales bacterium]